MESLGVYVSVPFCKAKCTFCNFASGAIGTREFGLDRLDEYVERLCGEIRGIRLRAELLGAELPGIADTIYLGGGTPSLLKPVHLDWVFAAIAAEFEIAGGAEVTLECAPGQLEQATLDAAKRLGVSRISLGVQSFVDAESAAVGRLHTAEQCRAEIGRLRAAGLSEISLDLIAGLPGQTAESWETSVAAVIEAGVPHASVYMLEVDDESRLGRELIAGGPRYGARNVPSDEAMTEFYARACTSFGGAGLMQYEISNFAWKGHESRHNLKYWRREPYVGFGLDAHSMLRMSAAAACGVRFANMADIGEYMAGATGDTVPVSEEEAAEEAVFLGLRMNEGIPSKLAGDVTEMVRDGLMEKMGDSVVLTERGRMVSSEVFAELLLSGVSATQ